MYAAAPRFRIVSGISPWQTGKVPGERITWRFGWLSRLAVSIGARLLRQPSSQPKLRSARLIVVAWHESPVNVPVMYKYSVPPTATSPMAQVIVFEAAMMVGL